MNTVVDPALQRTLEAQAAVENAIEAACERVAPTWPLDAFIAVNPWWGWREQPIAAAARELGRLAGTRLTMPRSFYRQAWQAGAFGLDDLRAAIAQAGATRDAQELAAQLDAPDAAPARLPLLTDLADAARDLDHAMAWRDFVTHHISQQCAAYFDGLQSSWRPRQDAGLYASWLRFAQADPSARLLMGDAGARARLAALPASAEQVLREALPALGLRDAQAVQAYCTALLASIGGWAAWAAYLRWQARLAQQEDGHLRELLAIRLAWDWVLQPLAAPGAAWTAQWSTPAADGAAQDEDGGTDWLLQSALELAWQRPLARQLGAALRTQPPQAFTPPDVVAVFCIDVRSEPLRRALEAAQPGLRTVGFAGFFGLPIAHRPLGAQQAQPQLPGLLAPQRTTADVHDEPALGQVLAARRRQQSAWRSAWDAFRGGAPSAFTFVEACGLAGAASLLRRSLGAAGAAAQPGPGLRPQLLPQPGATPAEETAARCALLANVLRAMGLAAPGFAWPALVLLAGHGSRSANNPFAAGLDCGACGGQSGEVNARVLAQLLNDAALRQGLAGAHGIRIPAGTRFVAGLHCTTTDEVELFDTDLLHPAFAGRLAQLRDALQRAGHAARAERAPALGLPATLPAGELHAALARRATDWSQVRPEWGLANNAAFIAAPRARTAGLQLQGRAFLHDYDWRADPGFGVLELIMTAPMVVANWINLQYHASVTDPQRYGSGNKVLHNVVGGRIGVFEGNGGDLRIGLPWQSVHDGTRFMHTPLRLSAFIEAPRDAIDAIVERHAVVRQLVDNGWLHLLCMEPESGEVLLRAGGAWRAQD